LCIADVNLPAVSSLGPHYLGPSPLVSLVKGFTGFLVESDLRNILSL